MEYDEYLKAGLDLNIYMLLVTQISNFGLKEINSNLNFS